MHKLLAAILLAVMVGCSAASSPMVTEHTPSDAAAPTPEQPAQPSQPSAPAPAPVETTEDAGTPAPDAAPDATPDASEPDPQPQDAGPDAGQGVSFDAGEPDAGVDYIWGVDCRVSFARYPYTVDYIGCTGDKSSPFTIYMGGDVNSCSINLATCPRGTECQVLITTGGGTGGTGGGMGVCQ